MHRRLRAAARDRILSLMTNVTKRSRKILLADDNDVVQLAVRSVAERCGHEVVAVMTGRTVFDRVLETKPDVVVLDIQFPDADGRDVLAKLKADAQTAHIPVVVWSGRSLNDSDSRISIELGAEDYVEKSDAERLIQKLDRVLLRLEQKS